MKNSYELANKNAMKKLIIIFALFAVVTVKGQIVYNELNFKTTPYIHAVCEELHLSDNVESIIVKPVYLDHNIYGFTIRIDSGKYAIFVNKSKAKYSNYGEIIAHEIYHIYQDINGLYDINKGTTVLSTNTIVDEYAQLAEYDAGIFGRHYSFLFRKKI